MEKHIVKVVGKRFVTKINKYTKGSHVHSVIYYIYQDDKINGFVIASKWIGSYCCPPGEIRIGHWYELYEENNYVVGLQPVENRFLEADHQWDAVISAIVC